MSSAVPQSVADWTLGTVKRVVAKHPHEPDWFDYKAVLTPRKELPSDKKEEHRDSIRRCACALSNTNGGFIIFGVKDKGDGEERIVGIDLKADLWKQFGDLIAVIDPNIRGFDAEHIPFEAGDRGVWIVQLPVSPLRPHMLDGRFYKRTHGGTCVPMSAHEIRDQMILSEDRVRKLKMLRSVIADHVRRNEQIGTKAKSAHKVEERFDASGLRTLVGELAGLLAADLLDVLLELASAAEDINRLLDWAWEEDLTVRTHPGSSTRGQFYKNHIEEKCQDVARLLGGCGPLLKAMLDALSPHQPRDVEHEGEAGS